MKQIIMAGIIAFGTVGWFGEEEKVNLTELEQQHFQMFGFSEPTVTKETYEKFIDLDESAIVGIDTTYMEMEYDQQGNMLEAREITETQAHTRSSQSLQGGDDYSTTDWMEMALIVTQLDSETYEAVNSWSFMGDSPIAHFRDVMAITHDTGVVSDSSTATFNYTTSVATGSPRDPEIHNSGHAWPFDLERGTSQSGNMSIELLDNGSTRAAVYGHYLHSNTPNWFNNVGISAGAISVSGFGDSSSMPTTEVIIEW
ncbi:hypothetical protein ACE1TF_06400 [Geomicrobium sp. JSM 1781026]|uniref:hypothetical protein n=1 Tax=Geomicrobium sp. JSM 1781026 TaxID=3344580 RepID=UPI0035BFF90C